MEGFNNVVEREEVSDWRERKEKAPEQVQELISKIEGFEEMETQEQINALNTLFETLEEDNKNNYIAREVSRICDDLIEKRRREVYDAGRRASV